VLGGILLLGLVTDTLDIVFVCGGLALMLDVSFLIASMVMGAVITNLAKHHEYPFQQSTSPNTARRYYPSSVPRCFSKS